MASDGGALTAFGEPEIKAFVQAAIDESLKLERAISQLRTPKRVVVLSAPVPDTVKGEPRNVSLPGQLTVGRSHRPAWRRPRRPRPRSRRQPRGQDHSELCRFTMWRQRSTSPSLVVARTGSSIFEDMEWRRFE